MRQDILIIYFRYFCYCLKVSCKLSDGKNCHKYILPAMNHIATIATTYTPLYLSFILMYLCFPLTYWILWALVGHFVVT